MDEVLKRIAKEELNINTLETQSLDILDFYTVSVWQVKRALEEDWLAGYNGVEE